MNVRYLSLLIFLISSFSCASISKNNDSFVKSSPIFFKKKKQVGVVKESKTLQVENDINLKNGNFILIQEGSNARERVIWPGILRDKTKLILKLIRNENLKRAKLKLKLQDVTVEDFINVIFGKILKLNYQIDDSVKRIQSKVNIVYDKSLTLKDFITLSLSLLDKYGIYPYWDSVAKLLVFKKSKEAEFLNVPIYVNFIPENLPEDKLICFVYEPQYIDLRNYYNFISTYITGSFARLSRENNGKILVSVASVEVNRKLLSFLKNLDKPVFKSKAIALIKLQYLEPKDFISKISAILSSLGVNISTRPSYGDIFLYPLGNNVLAICKNKDYCNLIKYWKLKIDTLDSVSWKGFYIYVPKNRNASDLVKILQDLKRSKGINFDVILDESRNQIILKGKKSVVTPIILLLKKLDTLPKQVLVETTIAEVTLKDELQYGLEWFFQHSGRFNGSLGTLNGLGVGGAGFTYNLVTSTGKFRMVMNMFAKKNLIKILSSPHVVVVNGKQATINVGTEVPVLTSEVSAADVSTSTNKPSILRNVSYRNTGIQLSIKPTILSKGIVELSVRQTISDAQANTLSSIDSPIILNRSISTSIIVRNGESVVLGGLISSNFSNTINKVPGLGDLPVVGNLFRTQSNGKTKTELILIITPKILTTTDEYINISNDIIRTLEKINALLQ